MIKGLIVRNDIHKFHYHKNQILIDKVLTSEKISFGKKGSKNFIGYKDVDSKIKPNVSKHEWIWKKLLMNQIYVFFD